MADLIELNISVKDQTVKQAVTTVSRLEREIIKAVKAVDSHQISQKRFDQILAKSKQEYKAYAGNAGLATININKFVKAQREAAQGAARVSQSVDRASQSSFRYAAAARSAGDATNRTRQAFLNTASSIAILDGPLGGVASRFSALGVLIGRTGFALAAFGVASTAIGVLLNKAAKAGMELETSMLSLRGAVALSGGAAGKSAQQIEELVQSIEAATLASRGPLREAAQQMLTFQSVTGETFDRALRLSQDFAQVFGKDVSAAAVQVAKALENPRQSLASLERAYGPLNAGVREHIIELQKQGRMYEAQEAILSGYESKIGGLADEAGKGLAGAFDKVAASFSNFFEELSRVAKTSEFLTRAAEGLSSGIDALTNALPKIIELFKTFSQILLVVAVTRIPALIISLKGMVAGLSLVTVTAAITAKTMLALGTAVSIAGGPMGIFLGVLTAIGFGVFNARSRADELADALGKVTTQQKSLNEASAEFYRNRNSETLVAFREQAEAAKAGIEAALAVAKAELSAAEFYTNFFGMSLFETNSIKVAKGSVEDLELALLEIARVMSGIDDEANNLSTTMSNVATVTEQSFTDSVDKLKEQNDLLALQAVFTSQGMDSTEARARAEMAISIEKANQLALEGKVSEESLRQFLTAVAKNKELLNQRRVLDSATGFTDNLARELEIIELQVEMFAKGSSQQEVQLAIAKLQLLTRIDQNIAEVESLRVNGVLTGELQKQLDLLNQMRDRAAAGDFDRPTAPSAPRAAGGGGRSFADEFEQMRRSLDSAYAAQRSLTEGTDKLNEALSKGLVTQREHSSLMQLLREKYDEVTISAKSMADELNGFVVSAIDSVANAFGDFVARGYEDFQSFAKSVVNSFKQMLSQMIAMAAKNQIMISLGMSATGAATGAAASAAGSAAGSAMGAGAAGAAGAGMGSAIFSGASAGFTGAAAGGLSGGAAAIGAKVAAGTAAGATGAAMMAAVAAVAAPLLAVYAVFKFFQKKTKVLETGLKATVDGFGVVVDSFTKTQTSRFFGLSKRTNTSFEEASEEVANPLREAVGKIQEQVVDAAKAFGFGADAFNDFSYQFQINLKGLSEEQQLQKINEELTKMGDSFASLTGHFSTMNELLEAAEQRYQIENRMLEALGRSSEVLARNRERELAATHALNRGLLQATFNLEDANAAVSSAMEGLRRAIDAEKKGLQDRANVINEAMSQTKAVFDMLSNALKSRRLQDDASFSMRRSAAQSFLRAGDVSDPKALEQALGVVAEPSEGLFSSFVDYARDFLTTSRDIADLEATAFKQLTIEEQMLESLNLQIDALDQQYQIQVGQFNALLGIDTSVKSVGEAIATLRGAIQGLASAQSAAKAAQAAGVGASSGSIGQFSTGKKYQGFDLLDVGGAAGLLQAAGLTGVSTSGKTGLQIAQDIANATGQAVQLDAASRVQKFARGGMFGGGMRMVGEEGPELEVTGPSRIYSKQQTKELLRGDSGNDSEGLRTEVSELRQELRQLLIAGNKYTKRSYDLYNKWDIDGLPAERT